MGKQSLPLSKHPEFHDFHGEDGDFRTFFRRPPADRTSKCGKFNHSISKYPDISPDWVSRNRAHHTAKTLYTLIWDDVK